MELIEGKTLAQIRDEFRHVAGAGVAKCDRLESISQLLSKGTRNSAFETGDGEPDDVVVKCSVVASQDTELRY